MLGTKKQSKDFDSTSMARGDDNTTRTDKSSRAGRMIRGSLQAIIMILVIVILFMWFQGHNEKGGFEQPDVVTELINKDPGY